MEVKYTRSYITGYSYGWTYPTNGGEIHHDIVDVHKYLQYN
jgi:hypothetical protein